MPVALSPGMRYLSRMNALFAFLDGRKHTLGGVAGTLVHETQECRYPYPHKRERLIHRPSPAGCRTVAYARTRQALGDDWVTDLTDDIERYCSIASKLGFKETEPCQAQ